MGVLRRSAVRPSAVIVGAADAPLPDPTLGESFGASARTTVDDVGSIQSARLRAAYAELADQLIGMGVPQNEFAVSREGVLLAQAAGAGSTMIPWDQRPTVNEAAVWSRLERMRQEQPDRFREIAANREEFERRALTRDGQRARDLRVVEATRGIAGNAAVFAGGMAGTFADPVNVATLPLGGGGATYTRLFFSEAIVNGLVEAAQQPGLAAARERMGETLTGEEAALNIAAAGVGAGVLGTGFRAAGEFGAPAVGRMTAPMREAALARLYPLLPERVRARFLTPDAVPMTAWADQLEQMRGRDSLTNDEIAAIDAARRGEDIQGNNPLRGVHADSVHESRLTEAMARILNDNPPSPLPAGTMAGLLPGARPQGRPALAESTALASGTIPSRIGGAGLQSYATVPFSAVRDRIVANEAPAHVGGYDAIAYNTAPGRNAAGVVPPKPVSQMTIGEVFDFQRGAMRARTRGRRGPSDVGSTGVGAYQFESLTLRENARLTFGENWREARFSPANQDRIAETLYNRVRGNPAQLGSTWAAFGPNARDVPAGSGRAVDSPTLADYDPMDERMAAIQAEIDATVRRQAELQGEQLGDPDLVDAATTRTDEPADLIDPMEPDIPVPDNEPIVRWPERPADMPEPERPPVDNVADGLPPPPGATEAVALRPETITGLRRLIRETTHSVSDIEGLVRRIGASEPEIRQALSKLAADRELVQRVRGGANPDDPLRVTYSRPPVDKREYAFAVIARNGGVRDELSARGQPAHGLNSLLASRHGRGSVLVPGLGPLVRKIDDPKAMTLDKLGEFLHERGFLFSREAGNLRERPTVSEVIDYLIEGLADPRRQLSEYDPNYAFDGRSAADLNPDDPAELAFRWAEQEGVPLDVEGAYELTGIIDEYAAGGIPLDFDAAYAEMVNRNLVDAMLDLWEELGDEADINAGIADISDYLAGAQGGRSATDAGNASPYSEGPDARAAREAFYRQWEPADDGWRSDQPLDSDGPWADTPASKAWDDPHGPAADEQAQSLLHDADAVARTTGDMFGGPTAAEKRGALERRMEGGASNGVEQKPAGSDGGLFDAGTGRQTEFLMDEDGAGQSLDAILKGIADEEDTLRNIRDCL